MDFGLSLFPTGFAFQPIAAIREHFPVVDEVERLLHTVRGAPTKKFARKRRERSQLSVILHVMICISNSAGDRVIADKAQFCANRL